LSSTAAALGDAREIVEQRAEAVAAAAAAGARAKEKATLAHTELAFARRRKNGLLRS